jgi:methionine biosynthesis protein MetW
VDPDQKAVGFVGELNPLRYITPQISFDPDEKNGLVSAMIPVGSRVLDVGCGTGLTAKELRDALGCEVVGLEPNEQRAEAARLHGYKVITGILDDLNVQEVGTFDVILFLDILEHLSDPASILETTKHFLKPHGFIVASVPNVAHWTVRLNLLRGKFDYADAGIMDATHLRWFTESTVRRLFQWTGYRVIDWKVSSGTWLSVYRTRQPWRWLNENSRVLFVKKCTRWFPHLFGCQHVVRAVLWPAL